MSSRRVFFLAVAVLAAGGLGVALLRVLHTGVPLLPGQERSVWLVEARVDLLAQGGPVTVSLSVPERLRDFLVTQERAASPGYGFAIVDDAGDRRAEWTRRAASGAQSLYYSAHFLPRARTPAPPATPLPEAESVFWTEVEGTAAAELLAAARETSSGPLSLARELVRAMTPGRENQNAALLLAGADSRAAILERLLDAAGAPARVVLALRLEDARRRQRLTPMVEVFAGGDWVLVDPQTGVTGVPEDLLLWHRRGRSLLDVTGAQGSRVSFSMLRQSVPARALAQEASGDSLFYRVGLHSLPIEEQGMFKMLLLLPLGATVVVFMRVLVGVRTAGTFMPVLIALALLQTSLVPGIASFLTVVCLGLVMRGYLSRLNLLLVARIATLIVLVVFIISALSIIGYQLGVSTGMVITFFPMIIIAWTIERMSILWEEEGAREVLAQGFGSLGVAVAAFALMQWPLVQHLSFNFPELNLTLLAAILAMGQYTGYKLSELRRFHAIGDGGT